MSMGPKCVGNGLRGRMAKLEAYEQGELARSQNLPTRLRFQTGFALKANESRRYPSLNRKYRLKALSERLKAV